MSIEVNLAWRLTYWDIKGADEDVNPETHLIRLPSQQISFLPALRLQRTRRTSAAAWRALTGNSTPFEILVVNRTWVTWCFAFGFLATDIQSWLAGLVDLGRHLGRGGGEASWQAYHRLMQAKGVIRRREAQPYNLM